MTSWAVDDPFGDVGLWCDVSWSVADRRSGDKWSSFRGLLEQYKAIGVRYRAGTNNSVPP